MKRIRPIHPNSSTSDYSIKKNGETLRSNSNAYNALGTPLDRDELELIYKKRERERRTLYDTRYQVNRGQRNKQTYTFTYAPEYGLYKDIRETVYYNDKITDVIKALMKKIPPTYPSISTSDYSITKNGVSLISSSNAYNALDKPSVTNTLKLIYKKREREHRTSYDRYEYDPYKRRRTSYDRKYHDDRYKYRDHNKQHEIEKLKYQKKRLHEHEKRLHQQKKKSDEHNKQYKTKLATCVNDTAKYKDKYNKALNVASRRIIQRCQAQQKESHLRNENKLNELRKKNTTQTKIMQSYEKQVHAAKQNVRSWAHYAEKLLKDYEKCARHSPKKINLPDHTRPANKLTHKNMSRFAQDFKNKKIVSPK
jgi:hypothetical protein